MRSLDHSYIKWLRSSRLSAWQLGGSLRNKTKWLSMRSSWKKSLSNLGAGGGCATERDIPKLKPDWELESYIAKGRRINSQGLLRLTSVPASLLKVKIQIMLWNSMGNWKVGTCDVLRTMETWFYELNIYLI